MDSQNRPDYPDHQHCTPTASDRHASQHQPSRHPHTEWAILRIPPSSPVTLESPSEGREDRPLRHPIDCAYAAMSEPADTGDRSERSVRPAADENLRSLTSLVGACSSAQRTANGSHSAAPAEGRSSAVICIGFPVEPLGKTRDQKASACGLVAVPGNGNPVVRHRFVSLEDHVGLDIGMLGA